MRDFIEECKLNKLIQKEKKVNPIIIVLAVVGVIVLVAAIAYAVYRFFTPDDMDDFEFEDEFDEDFFEDDDVFEASVTDTATNNTFENEEV